MSFSNRDIQRAIDAGEIEISGEVAMQPASVDLHLGAHYYERNHKPIDPYDRESIEEGFDGPYEITEDGIWIWQGDFLLVSTQEVVRLDGGVSAQVEGKSSLARLALEIHIAGFIDPGFHGAITLEVSVVRGSLLLRTGMPLCQLKFERLDTPTDMPYPSKGRYGGTPYPQLSQFHRNKRPS